MQHVFRQLQQEYIAVTYLKSVRRLALAHRGDELAEMLLYWMDHASPPWPLGAQLFRHYLGKGGGVQAQRSPCSTPS